MAKSWPQWDYTTYRPMDSEIFVTDESEHQHALEVAKRLVPDNRFRLFYNVNSKAYLMTVDDNGANGRRDWKLACAEQGVTLFGEAIEGSYLVFFKTETVDFERPATTSIYLGGE